MLCAVCYGVLRGHQGSQWRGTFDLHFDHHANKRELQKSAVMSCCMCRSILVEWSRIEKKNRKAAWAVISNCVRRMIWPDVFRPQFISAYLSEIYGLEPHGISHKVYRLDFKLRDSERVGTFVLEQTGIESNDPRYTPFSGNTSSDEVLQLARDWINTCTSDEHKECPDAPPDAPNPEDPGYQYPTRLIDLGEWDDKARKRPNMDKVRLVSKEPGMKGWYVTLSHCWGNARFTCLEEDKIEDFRKGILLKDLPKTFQHAIDFSRRLSPKVRYIWIDSLCIIQDFHGKSQIQRQDWLFESSQMYEIYKNSYCNLSATAAVNSNKGLFFDRKPHELWEDEINLNVEGIPGTDLTEKSQPGRRPNDKTPAEDQKPTRKPLSEHESKAEQPKDPAKGKERGRGQPTQRCTILDLSFWERNVDKAPVNRRGWVLQERLMAPRVLHFCQDQIAWECRKLQAAECARGGLPSFTLKAEDIVLEDRLKDSIPNLDGKRVRENGGSNGSIMHATAEIDVYIRWKHVVEAYSKTQLTKPSDKLIALSGIAAMMSKKLEAEGMKDKYVAGMWKRYLASQLLWHVDPVYENGQFYYLSKRPKEGGQYIYRAPSFSWAAIDAERGITYGEIAEDDDEKVLIKIVNVDTMRPLESKGEFGLVRDGLVTVKGVLKRIEMESMECLNGQKRYEWHLVGKEGQSIPSRDESEETPITYSNVYLDSPDCDTDILGPNGQVFCLQSRIDSKGYLICLLLQVHKERLGCYRRVGLTRIPPYSGEGHRVLLETSGIEQDVPYSTWDASDQKHTIKIV